MARRAYIVLARNDLEDNDLQVTDLLPPNQWQRDPMGQSGVLSFFVQNEPVVTVASHLGSRHLSADVYGLSGYLEDRVCNRGAGNKALTDVQAGDMATAILAQVAASGSLTLADINVLINSVPGVAISDLDGAGTQSRGAVEEILRILSGEVYKVPNGTVVGALANAFPGVSSGFFVTRPNLVPQLRTGPGGRKQASVTQQTLVRPTDRVRCIISTPRRALPRFPGPGPAPRPIRRCFPIPPPPPGPVLPPQIAPQDAEFRDIKKLYLGGYVERSAHSGILAKLKSRDYQFYNWTFRYDALSGVVAKTVADQNIPASGVFPAVVVYAYDGGLL